MRTPRTEEQDDRTASNRHAMDRTDKRNSKSAGSRSAVRLGRTDS